MGDRRQGEKPETFEAPFLDKVEERKRDRENKKRV